MTDREFLELAAKAAGITLRYNSIGTQDARCVWNPLEDDGEALRLAVKLKIDIVHFTGHVRADVRDMPDIHVIHGDDPYTACRRAIVRAAAEIGRSMSHNA